MLSKKCLGFLVFLVLTYACSNSLCSLDAHPSKIPELINIEEAEFLIYLLPEAQELRSQGMDISWELETSADLNQADFYVFWVINPKRKHHEGSVTVGYFGVNRHNAEVWSLDSNGLLSTPELEGAQRIIRQARSITETVVQQYHLRRPDAPAKPNR
jgi:hypothetical protein